MLIGEEGPHRVEARCRGRFESSPPPPGCAAAIAGAGYLRPAGGRRSGKRAVRVSEPRPPSRSPPAEPALRFPGAPARWVWATLPGEQLRAVTEGSCTFGAACVGPEPAGDGGPQAEPPRRLGSRGSAVLQPGCTAGGFWRRRRRSACSAGLAQLHVPGMCRQKRSPRAGRRLSAPERPCPPRGSRRPGDPCLPPRPALERSSARTAMATAATSAAARSEARPPSAPAPPPPEPKPQGSGSSAASFWCPVVSEGSAPASRARRRQVPQRFAWRASRYSSPRALRHPRAARLPCESRCSAGPPRAARTRSRGAAGHHQRLLPRRDACRGARRSRGRSPCDVAHHEHARHHVGQLVGAAQIDRGVLGDQRRLRQRAPVMRR